MSITRRKFIRSASIFAAGIGALFATRDAKPTHKRRVLGHIQHDDVSASLLDTYARSLALKDERARWTAQMMFHEAQLARRGGGTESQKLGYRHREFLKAHEPDQEPTKKKQLRE
jgi:hypothetical protein